MTRVAVLAIILLLSGCATRESEFESWICPTINDTVAGADPNQKIWDETTPQVRGAK